MSYSTYVYSIQYTILTHATYDTLVVGAHSDDGRRTTDDGRRDEGHTTNRNEHAQTATTTRKQLRLGRKRQADAVWKCCQKRTVESRKGGLQERQKESSLQGL